MDVDVKNRITSVTRRDIFELLTYGKQEDVFDVPVIHRFNFWGRLTPPEFLGRLYDLKGLPAYDSRCKNAEEDIARHTVANPDDYPDDWLFKDERFPIMAGSDKDLLDFLCEIFHPEVRDANSEWEYFKDRVNELLLADDYELYRAGQISKRDYFGWRDKSKPRFQHISDDDVRVIEKSLIRSGFVAGFSFRADLDAFTTKVIRIGIVSRYGDSMGGCLRQFLHDCTENQFITLCSAIIDNVPATEQSQYDQCRLIQDRAKRQNPVITIHSKRIKDKFSSEYIQAQIASMIKGIDENPTDAVGKAKELVESCCYTILERMNIESSKNIEFTELYKKVAKQLKITPEDISSKKPAASAIKALLGSLSAIVHNLGELRNACGTGHGKSASYKGLSARHARLAVGCSSTLVNFLWDSFERQQAASVDKEKLL